MEIFTIAARGDAYSVIATKANGKPKTVATYRTEQGAMVLLKRLQARADAIAAVAPIPQVRGFR